MISKFWNVIVIRIWCLKKDELKLNYILVHNEGRWLVVLHYYYQDTVVCNWNETLVHKPYTANIYSQFTVIGCVTFPTVIWQWLLQPLAVHMTLTDIEEYSLRLNNVLDCTIYNQITVGNVTLPEAVLSTVKIFAVYWELSNEVLYASLPQGASKLQEVKDLDLCTLLNKRGVFGNFQLQLLAVLMPFQIKHHTVPHLKGLNSGIEP